MLTNKIALVTGGSRGIGAAIARNLAKAGARVVINYVNNVQRAEQVRLAIEKENGTCLVVRADVGSVAQVHRMFDRVETEWGPVDILVNNAGIELRMPSRDFDEATYDRIMNTNLKGAFFCAQCALEGMKGKEWGRVINISSVHELTPTGFCTPYSMSKGGMMMMMRELAFEYSRFGITVNNVAPGAIRTDMNREVLSDPDYEAKVTANIPARFIGEPADVSKVVVFVASDEARYITGATIFVDGGLTP